MSRIEVKNASKKFGDTQALKDVSLDIGDNKIYGLLGRNGAGKTTLLNVITGRIFLDSGEVLMDGKPCPEQDEQLGRIYMMSEKTCYPEEMRVREAFKWAASFYDGFDRCYAEKLCGQFRLETKKKVKALSTGYKSIFKLIIALSTNAPYIFLDEPVLGLDANHRDLFYKTLIEKYGENPCTIVISTHLVEEVSGIVEDVVIIKDGELLMSRPCQELLAEGYAVSGTAGAVDGYIKGREVIGYESLGGLSTAYIMGEASGVPDGLEVGRLDLQKLFIQLTNDGEGVIR